MEQVRELKCHDPELIVHDRKESDISFTRSAYVFPRILVIRLRRYDNIALPCHFCNSTHLLSSYLRHLP